VLLGEYETIGLAIAFTGEKAYYKLKGD